MIGRKMQAHLLVVGGLYLTAAACAHSTLADQRDGQHPPRHPEMNCFRVDRPGELERMAEEIGNQVCVAGAIRVPSHGVHFETPTLCANPDIAYLSGQYRVHVRVDSSDILRMGIQDRNDVEIIGRLEQHFNLPCTIEHCEGLDLVPDWALTWDDPALAIYNESLTDNE